VYYRMTLICDSLMLVFSESYMYDVYILMYIYLFMWAIWYASRTYTHIFASTCTHLSVYICDVTCVLYGVTELW